MFYLDFMLQEYLVGHHAGYPLGEEHEGPQAGRSPTTPVAAGSAQVQGGYLATLQGGS